MLIFNSMLLLFSGFFTPYGSDASEGAVNVTADENYTVYNVKNAIVDWGLTEFSVMGVSVLIGVAAAWLMKSPAPIAAALFGGLMINLYLAPMKVIFNLTQNWIIVGFLSIITIIMGILAAIALMNIFAGGGVD